MLTISKPLSAMQAQTYHAKEFTAKEQNYWSQQGAAVGEWQGRLAAAMGLAGAVSEGQFARLSQGQHPETVEQLVRQRAAYEYTDPEGKTVKTMEHRAGWDATFSAPKSVSLTALVGGDDRVREAHRESVRVALEQLEHYTMARIGGNHPPEATAKFIAAKFEHDTARPVDGYAAPQLHTHAVIFNMTERENGQYRALQPQSLFASQQFATAIYQSELTYRLRQLGYEISAGRSGAPEIKGYTQEYLDASSPRSQQIREYLERTGRNGKEAAEIAAHSTRDNKEIHSLGEVMAGASKDSRGVRQPGRCRGARGAGAVAASGTGDEPAAARSGGCNLLPRQKLRARSRRRRTGHRSRCAPPWHGRDHLCSGTWKFGGTLGFRGIPSGRAVAHARHASSPRLAPSKQSRRFFVGCAKDEIKSSR